MPISCECGGTFRPLAKEGRTFCVGRGLDWPVPASFEIRTCDGCGEEVQDARETHRLDRAVRNLHLAPVLERIPEQWGRYGDIGPGWHEIVLQLDRKLREINPNYEVHQVKQKYGFLCYYTNMDKDPAVIDLVNEAVSLSLKTCESCGQPGSSRTIRTSHHTLCDHCDKLKRTIPFY